MSDLDLQAPWVGFPPEEPEFVECDNCGREMDPDDAVHRKGRFGFPEGWFCEECTGGGV